MMGRPKESKFEKEFVDRLRTLPNSYWPYKDAAPTIRGRHDRVGCINSKYISLEFKRSRKDFESYSTRSNLQEYEALLIKRAGGYAAFVYPENEEEIFNDLERISYENL